MTKPSAPIIKLNETENVLRNLLLDVAKYVDENPSKDGSETEVPLPKELADSPLVLRFTGGWVRDQLLGIGSHDIDVAINKMTGLHFGLRMKEYLEIPGNEEKYGLSDSKSNKGKSKGKSAVLAGLHEIKKNPDKSKHLETVTTKILGLDIDLVNLRKETYTEDSRTPQMEFGTAEEDALRRDATVNAMFYNLNTSSVEDLTGQGLRDMDDSIIRTPLEPHQTFEDDPLRVLRLIRFASRLNYRIDEAAEEAMKDVNIKNALRLKISRERVGIELEKMLRGPHPSMALSLIDRLELYETIFTDPTRDIGFKPETETFRPAYEFVDWLLSATDDGGYGRLKATLVPDSEDAYLSWIMSAMIPWSEAPLPPPPKPGKTPVHDAVSVAREGFKAPNKVADVINTALRNEAEINDLVDRLGERQRFPNRKFDGQDATARDVLGMAIRRWGSTWRSQSLFALINRHVRAEDDDRRAEVLRSYTAFLSHISNLDILSVPTQKPILIGTELAGALDTKPGPWMKDALDVVMAWQLRNPDSTDKKAAIEEVRLHQSQVGQANGPANGSKKEGKEKGESTSLASALRSHFLRLTLRPLFQNHRDSDITSMGRAKIANTNAVSQTPTFTEELPTWKTDPFALSILHWCIASLHPSSVEADWPFLVPPILQLLDDVDAPFKARGCILLNTLLERTPPELLAKTGLSQIFEDALMPCLTYLPTLTLEDESLELLNAAIPTLIKLAEVRYSPPTKQLKTSLLQKTPKRSPTSSEDTTAALLSQKRKYLHNLIRKAILIPYAHSGENVRIASTLLSHLPSILDSLGIDSVTHLKDLIPLLSNILADPLGPSYPPLLLAAAKGMQRVVLNCWPRIEGWRGEVLRGLTVGWVRVCESEAEEIDDVRQELRVVVKLLRDALREIDAVDFDDECRVLQETDQRLEGLFRT